MARTLTAAMLAEFAAGTVAPCLIAEIEVDGGFVRAWTGIGDLSFGGQTYTGLGDLAGVTPVRESSDIVANGVQFQLSGIPGALISTALGSVRWNKTAKLWLGMLNGSGALIADPYLLFSGFTDVPSIEEAGDTARLTLSAESRLVDLKRARVRTYTPEDQHIDYPDDQGFDFVAGLQDAQITFGG